MSRRISFFLLVIVASVFADDGTLIHVQPESDGIRVDLFQPFESSFKQQSILNRIDLPPSPVKWFAGDFNGDLKTDIAFLGASDDGTVVCFANQNLSERRSGFSNLGNEFGEYDASQRWFCGDFNGDGRDDLMVMPLEGRKLELKVFSSDGNQLKGDVWFKANNNRSPADWFFCGDFNGDGALDLLRVFKQSNRFACELLEADPDQKKFVKRNWTPDYRPYDPNYRIYPGDYTGDGRTDLAVIRSDDGKALVDVLLSGKNGFVVETDVLKPDSLYEYGDHPWYAGDFNGDGRDDLVQLYSSSETSSAWVYLSKNDRFEEAEWFQTNGELPKLSDFYLSDFNNDGRDDLYWIQRKAGKSSIDVLLSTGTNFKHLADAHVQSQRLKGLRGASMVRAHKYFDPHILRGAIDPQCKDYDAVCRSGQDIYFQQRSNYVSTDEPSSRIRAYVPQQVIETFEAKTVGDFARIIRRGIKNPSLVSAENQSSTLVQNLMGLGRRYHFGKENAEETVFSGNHFSMGRHASHQRINRVFVFNSSGQSAIKIREPDGKWLNDYGYNRVENCFVFGAGVDPQGNGRNPNMKKSWADAIGATSRFSLIRNNVVLDGTDVGIVIFTAPYTVIEDNVIATVSRSALGGINLLDCLYYEKWGLPGTDDDGRQQYNFSTLVTNNYLDARGGRIDIGIPVGGRTWSPPKKVSIKNPAGIRIMNNIMDGPAFAYGIALANGFDVTAHGNITDAIHSGVGGYFSKPNLRPDPADAFMVANNHVFDAKLDSAFVPVSERGLDFILFNTRHGRTKTPEGYRAPIYEKAEAEAIVNMAYLEMLGRKPTAAELLQNVTTLREQQLGSDELRLALMRSREFQRKNRNIKDVNLTTMQAHRLRTWVHHLVRIDQKAFDQSGDWLSARELYRQVLSDLNKYN